MNPNTKTNCDYLCCVDLCIIEFAIYISWKLNMPQLQSNHNMLVVVGEECIHRICFLSGLPPIVLSPVNRDLVSFKSLSRLQEPINLRSNLKGQFDRSKELIFILIVSNSFWGSPASNQKIYQTEWTWPASHWWRAIPRRLCDIRYIPQSHIAPCHPVQGESSYWSHWREICWPWHNNLYVY